MRRNVFRRLFAAASILLGGFTVSTAGPTGASAEQPAIHAETGGGHPDCVGLVGEIEGGSPTFTVPDPGDYGYFSWAAIYTKTANEGHKLHSGPFYGGETIESGVFNNNGQQQAISHIDLCPGPEPCEWNPEMPADDPNCKPPVDPCEWNPDIPADDPGCKPPPCEWNPDIPMDDPGCKPLPCEWNPDIPMDDPGCKPPPCEWNPDIPMDDPGCIPPIPCTWNPDIPMDDPGCVPPTPCPWNPDIPMDDPGCVPPIPCPWNPDIPMDDPGCDPPIPCPWNPDIPMDDPGCVPPTPCEWDSSISDTDPACRPEVAISALCREYELTDGGATEETVGFWYDVTNSESVAVTVSYTSDGAATDLALGAGETARVRVDSTTPVFSHDGTAITTPVPASDCEFELEVTKVIEGPEPGDSVYTVDLAYYDNGTETYIMTFELSSQEPAVITLPASYSGTDDPEAIEYIVREVGENAGTIVAYSPSDRFYGSGNVGEQVSVVITNAYAAVEIAKTVNDNFVEPGQIIFYELKVNNIGGLGLENIVIDDLFPATIAYVSYEIVGSGLPISCSAAPTPSSPDLLTCTVTGVLEAGQALPTIRVTARVGDTASSVDHFDNQSRVVGDYVVPGSQAEASPFARSASKATLGFAGRTRVAVDLRPAAPPPTEPLSCEPVEGQVCNVSPVVIATGEQPNQVPTTITQPPATTAPPTPTDPPATTTPGTPTTTPPPGTPTTVVVGGGELPETGTSHVGEAVLATLLVLAGVAVVSITRRRGLPS